MEVLPLYLHRSSEEIHRKFVTIIDVPAQIRIEYFLNPSLKHYTSTSLFGSICIYMLMEIHLENKIFVQLFFYFLFFFIFCKSCSRNFRLFPGAQNRSNGAEAEWECVIWTQKYRRTDRWAHVGHSEPRSISLNTIFFSILPPPPPSSLGIGRCFPSTGYSTWSKSCCRNSPTAWLFHCAPWCPF
jgi:hypothetical protein